MRGFANEASRIQADNIQLRLLLSQFVITRFFQLSNKSLKPELESDDGLDENTIIFS